MNEPFSVQELMSRLIDFSDNGATPEQWQSLAWDLAAFGVRAQVRLERLSEVERAFTALADGLQAQSVADAVRLLGRVER